MNLLELNKQYEKYILNRNICLNLLFFLVIMSVFLGIKTNPIIGALTTCFCLFIFLNIVNRCSMVKKEYNDLFLNNNYRKDRTYFKENDKLIYTDVWINKQSPYDIIKRLKF